MSKIIIDAKSNTHGITTHVKFKGNKNFTGVKKAIEIAERGEIENVHVVNRKGAIKHLRTNPDSLKDNNLDSMSS